MNTVATRSRSTNRFCFAAAAFCATAMLTACGLVHQPSATVSTSAPPQVPSIQGNWTGTQVGIKDVNNQPFQYMAQFNPDGSFSMNGNWQGMNGPAGQSMSGTYTQSGAQVSLTVTKMEAMAAGQTVAGTGFSTTATAGVDGKSLHVGSGFAEYALTRN